MEYKHCCVIDALKFYKTLVLVIIRNNPGEDGSVTSEAEVQYYAMLPGSLSPSGMRTAIAGARARPPRRSPTGRQNTPRRRSRSRRSAATLNSE